MRQFVLRKYPTAKAYKDLDGFWVIDWPGRDGRREAVLNDPRRPVRTARGAWKQAWERLQSKEPPR